MNDRSIRMYMSTTIEVAGLTVMLKLVGMPVYMQDRAVCNHRMLSRGRLLWQVAMHGGGGGGGGGLLQYPGVVAMVAGEVATVRPG